MRFRLAKKLMNKFMRMPNQWSASKRIKNYQIKRYALYRDKSPVYIKIWCIDG